MYKTNKLMEYTDQNYDISIPLLCLGPQFSVFTQTNQLGNIFDHQNVSTSVNV